MSLDVLGKHTSPVEVTHISSHGVWLLAGNQELFMSYDDFPWFKDVAIRKILSVEQSTPGHFYWPELDVVSHGRDHSASPERFPLKAK